MIETSQGHFTTFKTILMTKTLAKVLAFFCIHDVIKNFTPSLILYQIILLGFQVILEVEQINGANFKDKFTASWA